VLVPVDLLRLLGRDLDVRAQLCQRLVDLGQPLRFGSEDLWSSSLLIAESSACRSRRRCRSEAATFIAIRDEATSAAIALAS